jgi:hypothetical protein
VTGGLVRRPVRTLEGNVVTLNLLGSLAFGLAAVASYVVPSSGEMVNVPVVNAGTAIGALCFLVAAALLLPEGARTES